MAAGIADHVWTLREIAVAVKRLVVPDESKTRFLIVDDYGMGGIWGHVLARSADEAADRLGGRVAPDPRPRRHEGRPAGDGIIVFLERPDWMDEAQENEYAGRRTLDLDNIDPLNYFARFLVDPN
jgi:hypothetical protein